MVLKKVSCAMDSTSELSGGWLVCMQNLGVGPGSEMESHGTMALPEPSLRSPKIEATHLGHLENPARL